MNRSKFASQVTLDGFVFLSETQSHSPKTMDEMMDQTQEGATEETPVMPTEGEDMGAEAAPAPETGDEAAA